MVSPVMAVRWEGALFYSIIERYYIDDDPIAIDGIVVIDASDDDDDGNEEEEWPARTADGRRFVVFIAVHDIPARGKVHLI